MRLCTFILPGEEAESRRAGIVEGSRIFELTKRTTLSGIVSAEGDARKVEPKGDGYELQDVILKAPIERPGKILAAIVNTQGMLGGKGITLDRPRLDMKAPSAVIGPGDEIRAAGSGIRPEVELAAVVGRMMSRVGETAAAASIFGYMVLNDVTSPADSREDAYEAFRRERSSGEIRKTILRGPLFRSKNHDTFCPTGPWVSTPDEVGDWANLRMTTRFGRDLVQDGSTAEYLFTPAKIASYVSGFLTLEPGDVISCGSVGWAPGALGGLDPTEFVLPSRNDTLELEIEGLGVLRNQVSQTV